MMASSTASRVAVSAGKSLRNRNGPREVPPRIMTQGIAVWDVVKACSSVKCIDKNGEIGL